MTRVLVTGANGFVGQHLVKELADNGLSITAVGGPQGAAANSAHIDNYLVLDLSKPQAAQKIDFTGIDGVIHLAGLAAVGPSFDQPMEYITTNIGIQVNLFEAALAQKTTPRFLVISSGSLYDPKTAMPVTESAAAAPNSPYAVSKLGQEQMGMYYSNRGFQVVIARPFNHIGPGQNPGFIVPDLAQQIIEVEKGTAKEVMVGNLDAKRDYTDVRDIVRAYRLLLEKGRAGELYNVCSGKAMSGHEIVAGLLKAAGTSPKITPDPSKLRPSDIPEIYGSHDKLTADTDWQPEIQLEKTLTDVITDWRGRE